MILIITSSYDYTVDYLIDKFGKQTDFKRVNIDMLDKYNFIFDESGAWSIKCSTWCISKNQISSIYYRKPMLPDLSQYKPEYRQMISRDIISMITGLCDSFEGIVLTKPYLLKCVENKVYQLNIAKQLGFNMPKSLISNDLLRSQEFILEDSIIKPMTTGKILIDNRYEIYQTTRINKIEEEINVTPIYLQRYEQKQYEVRVTIINKIVYGVKIEAFNNVDWRKEEEKNTYSIIEVPEHIKQKCFKLLEKTHLVFGAIDFIVNKDGEWVFLEINPNGQWLWLEEKLNLTISKEIIKYLNR